MVGYCRLATTDCAAKAIMRQWLSLYFTRPFYSPTIVAYQWHDVIPETWCWQKAQGELDSCLFQFRNSVDGVNHFIILSSGCARRCHCAADHLTGVLYISGSKTGELFMHKLTWTNWPGGVHSSPGKTRANVLQLEGSPWSRTHSHWFLWGETLRHRNLGTSHPAMPRHHPASCVHD